MTKGVIKSSSSAATTNVYGRRRARRTIHITFLGCGYAEASNISSSKPARKHFLSSSEFTLCRKGIATTHVKDLFLTPIASLAFPLSRDATCAASGRQVDVRQPCLTRQPGCHPGGKHIQASCLPADQPGSLSSRVRPKLV